MDSLIVQGYAPYLLLKKIIEPEPFSTWLKEKHNLSLNSKRLFPGYKLMLETCLTSIFAQFSQNDKLQFMSDDKLENAMGNIVDIMDLDTDCEKAKFLKRLRKALDPIFKATNLNELKKGIGNYNQRGGTEVANFFESCIVFNKSQDFENSQQMLLVDYLYTFLTQINNNGPTGYEGLLQKSFWIPSDYKKAALRGYSYSLQYLWHLVVDKELFKKAKLHKLHTAKTWDTYVYLKPKKKLSPVEQILNRHFNPEKQTCLDNWFHHIQYKLMPAIEEKNKKSVVFFPTGFVFNENLYDKNKIFNRLLGANSQLDKTPRMSFQKRFEQFLLWRPIATIDSAHEHIHCGASTFISLLSGCVSLLGKSEREFDKIQVRRFIHNVGENKREYSYGILLDTKASAGHYHSGWLIFFECCGDYSGFWGREHRSVEELIAKLNKSNKIQFESIAISKELLWAHLNRHRNRRRNEPTGRQLNLLKADEDFMRLESQLNDMKAYLMELFLFNASRTNPKYAKRFPNAKINSDKKTGEKDIELSNTSEILLIECKTTPDNWIIEHEYNKALSKIQFTRQKTKVVEFWFWNPPSGKNELFLKKNKISYVVMSDPSSKHPLLDQNDRNRFRIAMGFRPFEID